MNVSKGDMVAIGFQALITGIIGGLYSLGMLYTERRGGGLLSVHTDALHVDRLLLSYCRELERRCKDLDIINFLQIIDAADRIVKLRLRLQDKEKHPAIRADADEAYTQLARLRGSMKQLVIHCSAHMTIKEQVDLEHLCTRMADNGIDPYMKAITLLTKNV